MQIKKSVRMILVITLFLTLFSTIAVAASSLFSNIKIPNIVDLYKNNQSWIDFIIFFLVFSSLTRLLLGLKFNKGEGKESPAFKPLYLGFGLGLSIGLTTWMSANKYSLKDSGPILLILLAIGTLGALIYWASQKGKSDSEKKLSWVWLLAMLLVFVFVMFFLYPNMFSGVVPYGMTHDILSLVGSLLGLGLIGLIIWGLIKVFSGIGKGDSQSGGSGSVPKWLKTLFIIILGLIILSTLLSALFGSNFGPLNWIFGTIGPFASIFYWIIIGGFVVLGAIILPWLVKFLNWNRKKAGMVYKGPRAGKDQIKVAIRALNGVGPFAQMPGTNATFEASAHGGNGNYSYDWRVSYGKRFRRKHSIPNIPGNSSQTITIDINTLGVNLPPSNKKHKLWILCYVTDNNNTLPGKGRMKFTVINQTTVPRQSLLHFMQPVRSGQTHGMTRNTTIQPLLKVEYRGKKEDIDEVRFVYSAGIIRGRRNIERSIATSTPLGIVDKNNSRLFQFTRSGVRRIYSIDLPNINFNPPRGDDFTIIAVGFKASRPIYQTFDNFYIHLGTFTHSTNERLEIASPTKGATINKPAGQPLTINLQARVIPPTTGTANKRIDTSKIMWGYEPGDQATPTRANQAIGTGLNSTLQITTPGKYTIWAMGVDSNNNEFLPDSRDRAVIEVVDTTVTDDKLEIIKPTQTQYAKNQGDNLEIDLQARVISGQGRRGAMGNRIFRSKVMWGYEPGTPSDPTRANKGIGVGLKTKVKIKNPGIYTIWAIGTNRQGNEFLPDSRDKIVIQVRDNIGLPSATNDQIKILSPTTTPQTNIPFVIQVNPVRRTRIPLTSGVIRSRPRGTRITKFMWRISQGAVSNANRSTPISNRQNTTLNYKTSSINFDQAGLYTIFIQGLDNNNNLISEDKIIIRIEHRSQISGTGTSSTTSGNLPSGGSSAATGGSLPSGTTTTTPRSLPSGTTGGTSSTTSSRTAPSITVKTSKGPMNVPLSIIQSINKKTPKNQIPFIMQYFKVSQQQAQQILNQINKTPKALPSQITVQTSKGPIKLTPSVQQLIYLQKPQNKISYITQILKVSPLVARQILNQLNPKKKLKTKFMVKSFNTNTKKWEIKYVYDNNR